MLTARQLDVLRLSATLGQRDIAAELGISRTRVRQHLRDATERLLEAS